MKEYLLLFWNQSGDGQYDVNPEQKEASMTAWKGWIGNIALQGKLVSTKPINWEGSMISNSGVVNVPAIRDEVMVTGYMICKSEDRNEVEDWSKSCPILQHPKGFVEIREVSPFEI